MNKLYRLGSVPLLHLKTADESDYHWLGIIATVLIILLSVFTSSYLNFIAFCICLIRIVRYGSISFSTDYCILVTVSLAFQSNGIILFPYLCLFAAMWFVCTENMKVDYLVIILAIHLAYLFTRMDIGLNNLVLCFSQFVLLSEMIREQSERTVVLSIKSFIAALFVSSLYAYIFRDTGQLNALRGPEAPAYWQSSYFRFNGLFRDPNYYMALLIVALSLLIKLRLKGKLGQFYFVAALISFTIFGLMTYSKTFLVLTTVAFVICVFLLLGRKKYLYAISLVAISAVVICITSQSNGSSLHIILHRFATANSISDLTTGRSELYARYLDAINESASSFVFGYGLSATYLSLSPHNLYLEVLYFTGFVGLLFFALEIVGGLHLICRKKPKEIQRQPLLMIYFPLILVGILFFSLAGMFSPSTYVMIFLALVSVLI